MATRALEEARQLAQEVRGHQPGISEVINEKITTATKSAKKIGKGDARHNYRQTRTAARAHTHTHITHGLFFLSVSNDLRNSNKKILKMVEEAKEKGNQIYEEALAQQQKLDALLEEAMNIKIQVKKARDQIKEGILGE